MGETAGHHPPPPPQAAPPSLGLLRGPTWTPAEQLQQLQYCIHSNPPWRQSPSFPLFHGFLDIFILLFVYSATKATYGYNFIVKWLLFFFFFSINCLALLHIYASDNYLLFVGHFFLWLPFYPSSADSICMLLVLIPFCISLVQVNAFSAF